MKNRIPAIVLAIIFSVLFSLLPVYPLLMEGREISQTGETLYKEWRFVSIAEYNKSEIFAGSAWQESIWVIYIILKITNYAVLFAASWFSAILFMKVIRKIRPKH